MAVMIIGGPVLEDLKILEGRTEKYVDTLLSKPSGALIWRKKRVDCLFLVRHTIMLSKINYQKNIWALCHNDHSLQALNGGNLA